MKKAAAKICSRFSLFSLISLISLISLFTLNESCLAVSQNASVASDAATPVDGSLESARQQYHSYVKQMIAIGIKMERFSLRYRKQKAQDPKFRRLRYFLAQESAAAGLLAFEISADDQFGKGKTHPLSLNVRPLQRTLKGVIATSIVGGSGSCLELGSNTLMAVKTKGTEFERRRARDFIADETVNFNALLKQADELVDRHSDSPNFGQAKAELAVLRDLEAAYLHEFTEFYCNVETRRVYENSFYCLNIATSAIGATGARYGCLGTSHPQFNGTSNVLFILDGALASASPYLSNAVGSLYRHAIKAGLDKRIGKIPEYDENRLASDTAALEAMVHKDDAQMLATAKPVLRSGMYSQSSVLYSDQLRAEERVMGHLRKVALQSSLIAPMIGLPLLTQGILGTVGYYNYPTRPRKELNLDYRGAVTGTVGAGIANGANILGFVADLAYTERLKHQHKLPRQLIDDRLKHLDDLERELESM